VGLERSPALVATLLGVLAAGAAYVPVDPTYPAERQRAMVADAQVALVVCAAAQAGTFGGVGVPVVAVETLAAEGPAEEAGGAVSAAQLAYVMYTSGSTGRPKGVMVPHRAITRLVLGTDYVELGPGVRVGQGASAAFDAATFEIWGALLHGATLVGIERATVVAPAALAVQLAADQVTVLWLTASVFAEVAREVPQAFAGVDTVLFGGEAVDARAVRAVVAAGGPRHLVNGYGPTEATTFSVCHAAAEREAEQATIPIGRPIGNTQVYVLDGGGEPVPVGVPGEIYIGGAGVGRGYWRQPGGTAARFVPDPFGAPGGRLYRTGDRGRYHADGRLEFLGRTDAQIKLRGHRIELGEIEAALRTHPRVAAAAVLLREDPPASSRLVAYIVQRESAALESPELRSHLKSILPEYMIPAAFVEVVALPLTPNGKVDRAALPTPDRAHPFTNAEYVPPRTPQETMLAAIWAELLDLQRVGIDDNFFEIGGHSLLATRLRSRIRDAFQIDLPLNAIFIAPTIAGLIQLLDEYRNAGCSEGESPVVRAAPDYGQLLSNLDLLAEEEVDALLENMADGEISQ
jgi:amino acid adenylation domain-containing protein